MTFPTIEFSEDARKSGGDALTLAIGWYFELTVQPEEGERVVIEGVVTATDGDGWILVEVDGQEVPVNVFEIERMVYL